MNKCRYIIVSERSFGDAIQHIEEYENGSFYDAKERAFAALHTLEEECPDLVYRIDLEKTETIWRTDSNEPYCDDYPSDDDV
jgi:hypothetical protein